MAIFVECADCKTRAEVPDSAAGAKGKCRTCGAAILVPGGSRKVCNGCGVDVAHAKRWKDETRRYYCDTCWQARVPSLNELDALCAAESSDVTLRCCDICGGEYPETYLTKLGPKSLCVSCHIAERKKVEQKRANRAEARKDLARQAGNKAKNAIKFATLAVVGAVAVAVVIVAIATHNDHSDWQEPTFREQKPGEESYQVEQQQNAQAEQRRAAEEKEAASKTEQEEQARRTAEQIEAAKPNEVSGEIYLTRGDGSLIVPADVPVYVLKGSIPLELYSTEMVQAEKIVKAEEHDSMWKLPGMDRYFEIQEKLYTDLQGDMNADLEGKGDAAAENVIREIGLAVMQKFSALRTTRRASGQYTSSEFSEYAALATDQDGHGDNELLPRVIGRSCVARGTTDRGGRFAIEVPRTEGACLVVAIVQTNLSFVVCGKLVAFPKFERQQKVTLNSDTAIITAQKFEH